MSSFAAFNPYLADSAFVHRVAVDRLKWQLGEPLTAPYWPLPHDPDWPLLHRGCFNGYYPWAAPSGQYHYSMGFRDGLSASRSGDRSGASTPGAAAPRCESPSPTIRKSAASSAAANYPGDLMEFPSAGYRRPLSCFPVSNDTSYDDLTLAWPYGCKPFYFRHADPPSVRYC